MEKMSSSLTLRLCWAVGRGLQKATATVAPAHIQLHRRGHTACGCRVCQQDSGDSCRPSNAQGSTQTQMIRVGGRRHPRRCSTTRVCAGARTGLGSCGLLQRQAVGSWIWCCGIGPPTPRSCWPPVRGYPVPKTDSGAAVAMRDHLSHLAAADMPALCCAVLRSQRPKGATSYRLVSLHRHAKKIGCS
jgi:hypothetical protein